MRECFLLMAILSHFLNCTERDPEFSYDRGILTTLYAGNVNQGVLTSVKPIIQKPQ